MSLNVLNSGEIAATGGTSGVLYGLTDNLKSKEYLRINNFAHVNYSQTNKLIGKLLCLNGAGIQYKWIKNLTSNASYLEMNKKASHINIGSNDLSVFPFGNGAERIFNNKNVPSRQDVIEQLIPYIKDEIKKGTRLNQIMRHTLGLFHGQTGASYWKRYLSENMCVRDADVKKIDHIMDKIKYNNVDTSVGQSA